MKFNYDIKFTDNTPQLHETLDSCFHFENPA